MLASTDAASNLIVLAFLIGLIVLQICLIVAVFRTSRATQDTAILLGKALRELKYIGDQLTPPQ